MLIDTVTGTIPVIIMLIHKVMLIITITFYKIFYIEITVIVNVKVNNQGLR